MKTLLHRADSRGQANHGWLQSRHTFSFAGYYHPERMHFGMLRVLNDDQVAGGQGFPSHPHHNMEIISIPLQGDLVHKDSMGNGTLIRQGDVQIMSAGTGVVHSEYNHHPEAPVHFLQIWVLPQQQNIQPRYAQQSFPLSERHNRLQVVVSSLRDDPLALDINQDATFSLGQFDAGFETSYTFRHASSGVYVFVLEGQLKVGDIVLERRDGLGLWETKQIQLRALSDTEVLLMEVPMTARAQSAGA